VEVSVKGVWLLMTKWNRESIKMILKHDYKVFSAKTLKRHFFKSKNTLEVVLLDIILPGIDGLKVLEKIKEKQSDTIVIMITATNRQDC
jgi:DNA-binding response OmpR family regulator